VDPRNTKLADLLVNYSVNLKKGEKLLIESYGFAPVELVEEIITIANRKGALVFYEFRHDSLRRAFLRSANEEQIKAQAKYPLYQMRDMDCYIGIRASENITEMSDVPSQKTQLYGKHYLQPVHYKTRVAKTRWVVMRYPNSAMAQGARMSQRAFADFYYDVCTLNYRKMSKAMDPLKRLMDRTDRVQIKGPQTDLTLSLKGIPSVKADGTCNIPDGECFTAPVRNSVEGTVLFNAGSLYEGTIFDDIHLTFRKGKVVSADAGAQTKQFEKILGRDAGVRYVGEFALGFNPHITKTMRDILFDEKIAGSFHMALGNAYNECDNGNRSSVHWDLIQIQTPQMGGGEIWFDGKLIRKDGRFVPQALQGLNPEKLK